VFVVAAWLISSSVAFASGPRLVKGPYMTELDDHDVTVRFQLEGAASAAVHVARDDGKGDAKTVASKSVSGVQVARMTGLEPAVRYVYDVRVGAATIGAGRFSTGRAGDASTPSTFLVYGDNRTDDAAHAAVVQAMTAVPSDFIVQTGDMVADGGNEAEWQRFFDIERPLLADHPIFSAIGNHELVDDRAGAAFARYFAAVDAAAGRVPPPYSTTRIGNVRLFLLNTVENWQGDERDWLERELARSDAEGEGVWRIAVMHHGPWAAGPHGPNQELLDAHVPELLAAHKIDLVLSGHDHIYERGAAVLKYIVSGGGGAPLYPVHPTATTRKVEAAHHFVTVSAGADALRVVAIRVDGSVIERCGFERGGPWDCDAAPSTNAGDSGGVGPLVDAAPPRAAAPPPANPPAAPSPRCTVTAPGTRTSPFGVFVGLAAVAFAAARRRASAWSSRRS